MSLQIFTGATIYTPLEVYSPGVLVIEGSVIHWVGEENSLAPPPAGETVNLSGKIVIPGLIDLHAHGALGNDFGHALPEDIRRSIKFHQTQGTTSLLASVSGLAHREIIAALERLALICEENPALVGIHLEGPYIAPQSAGILPKSACRKPNAAEASQYWQASGGWLKSMTFAPELDGAENLLNQLQELGIIPALGHTRADYATARNAIANGANYATHTFNTMPAFHHRRPGTVGAILDGGVWTEVIADGVHLHPAVLRLLWRLVGRERLVLASDSSPLAGLPPGEQATPWGNLRIEADRVVNGEGQLAGGFYSLLFGLLNFRKAVGCGLQQALALATLNPATVLGLRQTKGSLAKGKDADLVILDAKWRVESILQQGKICAAAA